MTVPYPPSSGAEGPQQGAGELPHQVEPGPLNAAVDGSSGASAEPESPAATETPTAPEAPTPTPTETPAPAQASAGKKGSSFGSKVGSVLRHRATQIVAALIVGVVLGVSGMALAGSHGDHRGPARGGDRPSVSQHDSRGQSEVPGRVGGHGRSGQQVPGNESSNR